jgi:asparagine synthase (glutamine-hydrolysing)
MCGIAGIVAPEADRYRPALERMVAALRHRGPDGSGIHVFPGCALGHTRLTIVDLTTGDQPMLAADGTLAITFNGEIYGFREIKQELTDYRFHTTSDTEVILALYQTYGENYLQHLPGMFAFAMWDERERALFAARDRFGEKPFYYAWGPQGEFVFASEIKALTASGLLQPKISRESLVHYLRYLYVHPHRTIYSNVFVLPPAHSLRLKGAQLSLERYWQLPATIEVLSEQDAIAEFRRLFERAVERQLIADVPVGSFLSGGLDSSSVVAVASQHYPRLKTFSFGFRDSIDELPFARQIAELYDTDHVELEDQQTDIAELMVEMARVYDEPFADSSNIPTYLISQAARRYGKVVITGDGGDELLAGYDFWYRPLWEMEHGRAYPKSAVALLWYTSRALSGLRLQTPNSWQQLMRGAALKRNFASIADAHLKQQEVFSGNDLRQLGMNGADLPPLGLETDAFTGTVDDALRMDLANYMPGDILVKTDRASMAHGLELRTPYLDVDFASFCISLPSRLKMTPDEDKWILRRSYGQAWTESIRRRKKCGFGAPVDRWLKRDSVRNLKARILDNPAHSLFSLLPFEAAQQFVVRDNYQTWILLTLGLWLESGAENSL